MLVMALLLAGCDGTPSALNPRGEGATSIANLWWIMLAIAVVVYIQVVSLLTLALTRRRPATVTSDDDMPTVAPTPRSARTFILVNGIALPIIILIILFGFNLSTLAQLSPPDTEAALTIEVIGHRWWWEVRYPQQDFVTANEIHIPTGTQVEIRLSSEDVIHSLWVPALNGKTDLIPGQSNRMFLYTDTPGAYQGQCAEFCGVQHAHMRFIVMAHEPDEFARWVAGQREEAPQPEDALVLRGQQVFHSSSCVYCHAIRGTNASGVIGPDLTHFASRATIGAGALENTPGNLAGWIIDPQASKPGNLMPPIYLEGDQLQALLAYMATLQ